ncbi:TetR/AcrR family transcriptional regulator [Niallia taxi]|uniref:TetR/AcrR family transcriptional regulator n=1 Tax=Niallia taxi TaxID=2499688 RepID=A0A3S2W1T5_9BACI|nr:TetR/AcrR family transcriptional regulator [Niallia taxi]MCM3217548.1 TetR/AcrR family transcriptional regulator [Niallia taxi]MDK8642908.1 TetR/AcrR family transcriptional regulator [Niallia taxi]MED4036607.1 TetR/AcrR family transcriptional regulator [Niallia taxi]MED4054354.1 TetR/AcrR family transcriptional regulator [Niallia taxi]MED4120371.1 TetR/AcrR family transcriptional regulator [Niallia taxi]
MGEKGNTRELILETASRLFQTQGYYGTGLNQIIAESKTPKGSLYYYFPNGKEELAIEAIKYTENLLLQKTKEMLFSTSDPIVAFQLHLNEIAADFDKKESVQGMPIGLIASETASTCEPIRKACVVSFEKWQAVYTEKLIESGFPAEEAADLSIVINSMIEGAIVLCLTKQSGKPLRIVSEKLSKLLSQEK